MTKVECLRGLATKLGANITAADDTVCKVLHKIGEAQGVKPVENQKYVVNVTGDTTTATSDKTLVEIYAAHQAGKIIECHYGSFSLHPLMMSNSVCSFSCDVMSTSTTCQRTTINITSSGAGISVLNYELTPVTD